MVAHVPVISECGSVETGGSGVQEQLGLYESLSSRQGVVCKFIFLLFIRLFLQRDLVARGERVISYAHTLASLSKAALSSCRRNSHPEQGLGRTGGKSRSVRPWGGHHAVACHSLSPSPCRGCRQTLDLAWDCSGSILLGSLHICPSVMILLGWVNGNRIPLSDPQPLTQAWAKRMTPS